MPKYAKIGHKGLNKQKTKKTNKNQKKQLDDGWPESVEEQGLLLLVWRHNFTNNIMKDDML